MTTILPWESPKLVDAAIDVACRVRDEHPDDIRDMLDRIPRAALNDLVLVLGAMVDADAPLDAVRYWTRRDFIGYRERQSARCRRGHLLIGENALSNGLAPDGRPRWRCRTCTHERRKAS